MDEKTLIDLKEHCQARWRLARLVAQLADMTKQRNELEDDAGLNLREIKRLRARNENLEGLLRASEQVVI